LPHKYKGEVNMIGFENFSVSAWFENGLTRHVSVPKIRRRVGSALAAVAVSTTLAASPTAAVAKAASLTIEQTAMTGVKAPVPPEVPVGYWPSLMSEMKSWAPVAEPDIDYPD
jgi:hypothetical protein